MVRGVVFDCFGVLYVDASHHFYEYHIHNYEELRPQLLELNRAADYGFISQTELSEAVADLTGLDRKFVADNIMGTHKRNDHLLEYVQKLRKTCKVGMLSNVSLDSMATFFSPQERAVLFDAVVLSGEERLAKPHPQIYMLTAERLGVLPSECVMIDDGKENCAGADAAGMKTILYRSNTQTIKELERLLGETHA